MRNRERSRGGCWTCKLRKKKCDESHPVCMICRSLGISCSGYGPRPPYMDGGELEKAMVESLRLRVKETVSRKKKHQDQPGPQSQLDLKPGSLESDTLIALRDGLAAIPSYAVSRSAAYAPDWPPCDGENAFGRFDDDESTLFMHYLDYSFPLQFPFYKPTVQDGGRGWLAAILMQTEPLYHAALSIASYHQHYVLINGDLESSRPERCWRLDEQLRRQTISLEKLQTYLQEAVSRKEDISIQDCVKLLACMVFLISIEAFQGANETWKMHLKAASSFIPKVQVACEKATLSLSVSNGNALHFSAATLSWYGILSCTTPDQTYSVPVAWLGRGVGYLSLEKLMGCEEWAMLSINDITELGTWKKDMQAKKQLSLRDLANKATRIESTIEMGLTSSTASIASIASGKGFPIDLDNFEYGSKYISLLITQIFAHAAMIYLYATISGPNPELPEIKLSLRNVIMAFQKLPRAKLIRTLTWPLCISACMATEETQDTFRELAHIGQADLHVFGSSKHVLKIMEECWRIRNGEAHELDGVDWTTAMNSLSLNVLLV